MTDPSIISTAMIPPPATEPPPPPPPPDSKFAQADQVPDLPCPKCGSCDVRLRYAAGCQMSLCKLESHRERFERYCRRCSYEWATYEMNSEGGS